MPSYRTTSEATQLAMHADPTDPRHGTRNGYTNLACRCDKCRKAWAAYIERRKWERSEKPVPEHVHGTENGYGNYMCRCDDCTKAWTTGQNRRAKARRAKRRAEKKSSEG